MDLERITVGKKVAYKSRAYTGVGAVAEVKTVTKGVYIYVEDKKRGKVVAVRPSQISSAK